MAVRLRLLRIGKRNRPCYRLCAVDSRKPRGGAYLESIGFYDPYIADDQKKVKLDRERAEYWLSVGAQPSETIRSFFEKAQVAGLVSPEKPKRQPRKKPASVQKRARARAEAKVKAKARAKAKKAKKAEKAKAEAEKKD
jgi:small subunit ribosomal protein S16